MECTCSMKDVKNLKIRPSFKTEGLGRMVAVDTETEMLRG